MNQGVRYCNLFVIMLVILSSAESQDRTLLFENYSSRDGLSQNSCYDISQDGRGFMWLATQDGLNRYDGHEFRVYLPDNEIGGVLPSNHITSLEFDSDENIMWVGTMRGISLYHQEIDSVVSLSSIYPFAVDLEELGAKKIIQFQKGELWIVSQKNGLVMVNLESKSIHKFFDDEGLEDHVNGITYHRGEIVVAVADQIYTLDPSASENQTKLHETGVKFSEIKELYSFRDQLWVGTYTKGCYYIEDFGSENHVVHFEPARVGGIGAFMTDPNGHLWIGTRGNGILVYDPMKEETVVARHNRFDDRSLRKDFILSLFVDRQGLTWCGLSGGGFSKYDPLKYQFSNLQNDPLDATSLPGNMVFNIFKSKSGMHYIGTQNKGFIQWDMEANRFYEYSFFSKQGVPENTVYDIINDGQNSFWLATWGGLIHFDEAKQRFTSYRSKKYPETQNLYAVHKLQHKNSLLVASEHGMMYFSLKQKEWLPCAPDVFQENAIIGRHILEDKDGILWIGTEGGGLVRLDYVKQEIKIVQEVSRISENVRYVLKEHNSLWLATDQGIVSYDMKKDTVIHHIRMDGIHQSNVCYSIQKDQVGNFWIGTNFGLLKLDRRTHRLQNYNITNGLKFLEFNTACTLAEEDGTLLFGGVGGITKFNPLDIVKNTFSPDPIITSVRVNNQNCHLTDSANYVFGHQENDLTFHYTANNFSNHERNQYYYRVQGLMEQWKNNQTHHTISFNSVPPGSYSFQVRSVNSDGIQSEGVARFSFIIQPPWWKTWWFMTVMILSVLFIAWILIKRRIRSIRNQAELKQRIAETEMMALRAQMNPHFIFNCLNSIDAFIQSNDKYQATTYLNKFARLLRNVLDSSNQNTVTFSKDFETLKLYLELEQLRNSNKFTTHIHADKELMDDDFQVPPLLIQPYVENAILHGLKYRTDNAGKLMISAYKLHERIYYVIEDNGVGRAKSKNGISKDRVSYGMKMTSDRVRYFNSEIDPSVTVTDLTQNGQAAGTRIEVLLDIK